MRIENSGALYVRIMVLGKQLLKDIRHLQGIHSDEEANLPQYVVIMDLPRILPTCTNAYALKWL